MKTAKKLEVITVRVERKIKEDLIRRAAKERRELSDYLRLLFSDIVEGKIEVPPLHEL